MRVVARRCFQAASQSGHKSSPKPNRCAIGNGLGNRCLPLLTRKNLRSAGPTLLPGRNSGRAGVVGFAQQHSREAARDEIRHPPTELEEEPCGADFLEAVRAAQSRAESSAWLGLADKPTQGRVQPDLQPHECQRLLAAPSSPASRLRHRRDERDGEGRPSTQLVDRRTSLAACRHRSRVVLALNPNPRTTMGCARWPDQRPARYVLPSEPGPGHNPTGVSSPHPSSWPRRKPWPSGFGRGRTGAGSSARADTLDT
jgi:hypothetical protein